MTRLYANENFPLPVVEELRHYGHDVLTIQETGYANQSMSDDSVLDFATAEKRVVLTFNRKHFIRLHNERSHHAGIVVCTYDANFSALAQRIHTALGQFKQFDHLLIRIYRTSQN